MLKGLKISLLAAVAAAMLVVPAFAQAPIKIGVLTPLSPPGDAAAGQFIVRGAKMAADEVNASGGILGGRKIELVIEDDSGTPEKGVAGLRKLASQDKVSAVIGQFHSSVMEAMQDLAEQFKVPIFSTQASAQEDHREAPDLYLPHPRHRSRSRGRSGTAGSRSPGLQAGGASSPRTPTTASASSRRPRSSSRRSGVEAELKTIIFDRAVVDLTPQLLEIKNWKPDVLINIGVGTPTYLIIKQASDVGLSPATPMLISYDAPARAEYWKNLGEKGNYASFIVYYHPTMKLTPRGRGLPQQVPRAVQGGAGLRRRSTPTRRSCCSPMRINAAKSDKTRRLW